MSTTLVCQHCGAPWQPEVTGACRFCRVVAPPPGAPSGVGAGRALVDPDVLFRRLLAGTVAPGRPLDDLATCLQAVAGDRVSAGGNPVSRLSVHLDDWTYSAGLDHGEVEAVAVHAVRGVVLKREALAFDEWVACVAADLARYASTHRAVYDAIVALPPG